MNFLLVKYLMSLGGIIIEKNGIVNLVTVIYRICSSWKCFKKVIKNFRPMKNDFFKECGIDVSQ
jgi:hypothetical protein